MGILMTILNKIIIIKLLQIKKNWIKGIKRKKKREIEWKEKNQIKEKNKNDINDNNPENKSAQNKENNRRITLKSMPFGIFADDIKNENNSIKKKKNSQILLPNRKRKELNESDNESVKDKENKIKKRSDE